MVGGRGISQRRGRPRRVGQPECARQSLVVCAFPAAEARRIAKKLEFHYTPKHGSWLDVAECELAVLASQCLAQRLPDMNTVRHEIAAWERQRNVERPTVKWHFTTAQARRKLQFLYPHPA
jgi:hypothetical protein